MRWIAAAFLLCGRSFVYKTSVLGGARALAYHKLPFRSHRVVSTLGFFPLGLSGNHSPASPLPRSSSSSTSLSQTTTAMAGTGYLNAVDAAALDAELMSTPGFSLEQLMELAGLAVAEAVYQVVPPSNKEAQKILWVCGPGNNGGDGLVAARHLSFFGKYDCTIVYPKRPKQKQHFINLVQQCEDVGIPVLDELPDDLDSYHAVVDAIFGFSFKGSPREPFGTILRRLRDTQESSTSTGTKVISVDVPSGWNVDEGDVAETGFRPDVLISLTAPKLCTKGFQGRHFIGGRFLPPAIGTKYKVRMPPYPGVAQVMEVTRAQIESESSPQKQPKTKEESNEGADDSWWEEYASYMAEKEKALDEATEEEYASYRAEKEQAHVEATDTTLAFDVADAPASVSKEADTNDTEEKEETWEEQYAAYCIEKEARLAEEDARKREALRNEENSQDN